MSLLLISSIIFGACSSDGTGPTTGTLAIDVTTTGVDIDANGFFLSVDGKPTELLSPNGSVDWVGGGGSHTLSISGLAFNCTLTRRRPRQPSLRARRRTSCSTRRALSISPTRSCTRVRHRVFRK